MQDQPNRDLAGPLDPDVAAGAVLGLLVTELPGLQTVDELSRKLTGLSGNPRRARIQVEDALADLIAHGLVHRLEEFVIASQAGIRGFGLTG
ncbi:MAG: hypothetical protein ITG02_10475 [Patulibacter sp.]|nr:hypothetical protein [Patulibacter sp.]